MPTNKLRAKFAAGRKCLGVWSNVIDTIYTESLAAAGFDFIILDNEHGPSMPRDTLLHMQVLSRMDCAAVVRVPWNDQVYIKRVLDAGADTIMVPMVETAEEAKAAVAACRYPPQGRRSTCAVLFCRSDSKHACAFSLSFIPGVVGHIPYYAICTIECLYPLKHDFPLLKKHYGYGRKLLYLY